MKAENYDTDYKLQVWAEIDNLIDNNIADFLEVATVAELKAMLEEFQAGVKEMPKSGPDIQKLIEQLQVSIAETILRVETAAN